MKRISGCLLGTTWVLWAFATGAAAQGPVVSLMATEVNGRTLTGGPTDTLVVAPGDAITAKVFARDWSHEGQGLKSYQIQMIAADYSSGSAGMIAPVDFQARQDAGKPNESAAFIDQEDPDFVFLGSSALVVYDVTSASYRLIGLIPQGVIFSDQDGTGFYLASILLEVSEDAAGTFTLGLEPQLEATQLRDGTDQYIQPLERLPLTLIVEARKDAPRIVSSIPPTGAIDARSAGGGKGGYSLELSFSASADGLSVGDFSVSDGSPAPPSLVALKSAGSKVTITLDRRPTPGLWTTVSHTPSATFCRIGALPGDVNNDRQCDARDVLALINSLNGVEPLPTYQCDINGDGSLDAADLIHLVDLSQARAEGKGTVQRLPQP